MPSITTQVRAQIGQTQGEQTPSRTQIKAPTGMNLPPLRETKPIDGTSENSGQSVIKEETNSGQAVTLSPQLTALARKQQKLQSEIQAQRDREAEWAKKQADFVPKTAFKAKLQQNAAEALSELGTTYEELTQALLAQTTGDDPVKNLESKIEKLEKAQEDSVNKQYEATLRQYKAETDQLIATDPKTYHFIAKGKKNGEWGDECPVTQHIVETWKENPEKVLTVDQAAKEIEEFLRQDAKAKADLLRELDPPAEETQPQAKKTLPPPSRAATRTLTEQVSSTPTRTQNMFQHLSMKERIAHSIARAQK